MSDWLIPFAALAFTAVSCIMATIYIAIGTVTRASAEDMAARAGNTVARARINAIFDKPATHARAVGLVKIIADLCLLVSLCRWTTDVRSGGTGLTEMPDLLSFFIALGTTGVILFLFGIVLPMGIATHAGARVLYTRSLMIRIIERAFFPATSVAGFFDEVVRRLAGAENKPLEEQVQDELMSAVEEGEREGALDTDERDMIEAVMSFGDLAVAQIMTPRTEMEAIEYTNNLGDITKAIRRIGHSRIPVYEESLDQITGIFYVKDLMRWLAGDGTHGGGKPFELRSVIRPAVFVPETKTVRELLKEMMDKKVHIALVADEYGGTAGLVTIEDIFEEIVGDIKDEYEVGPAEIPDVVLKVDQRKADVDGAARIADVNDALTPLGVEIPESEEYDTVGGFVITTLGRIPGKGEKFQHERMEFTILEAKPTRVVKVGLEVRDQPALDSTAEVRGTPLADGEVARQGA